MFKITRDKAYKAPSLKVDEECLDQFGRVGVTSVLGNIRDQKQSDGSQLKENAQVTKDRKHKLGLPQLSLVWIGHRLVRGKDTSYKYQIDVRGQYAVVEPSQEQMTASHPKVGKSTASPAELSQWVQEMGYTGWLGINDKGREGLRHALRKFLQRTINKAREARGGSV